MDIDTFLIALLIDYFEENSLLNGVSQEELNSMYYNERGEELDDKAFFFRYRSELLDDQLIDAVYVYLISEDFKEFQFDRVLSFLLSNYFVHNYNNGKNPVIKYLKSNDYSVVKQFFMENYDFGMDLLKSYFRNIGNTKGYMGNNKQIEDNGDYGILEKYSNIYSIINVKTISVVSRNVIINLYDFYISMGASHKDALSSVWAYFTSDLDPLNELEDQYGIDDSYIPVYKRLMLGFIIGDVFEDVCNDPILEPQSEEDRMAQAIPVLLASLGVVTIPGDEETRNIVLEHFITLQEAREKKKVNRDATYKEERIPFLRKINPLYKIDEYTL